MIPAPAKINLTLEVVGIESNGYHLLDTVFCWLELCDTLRLERAESTSFTVEGEPDLNLSEVTPDESNLVFKALRAVEREVGRVLPTRMHLWKRIPSGGGLGGGSADAAAALVGLNAIHDLGLSQATLHELARPLGADVAFGLIGGTARGTRYGDILESLGAPALLDRELVLVMPGFPCPTPKVYSLWDEHPSESARGSSARFIQADNSAAQLRAIANDLEEPAFRLHPQLREVKDRMVAVGLEGVCLSGSGSTLFGFLKPQDDIARIRGPLLNTGARIVKTRLEESTRFGLVS